MIVYIHVASVRSQLHSLCEAHSQEALLGIKDFLRVDTFEDGEWKDT